MGPFEELGSFFDQAEERDDYDDPYIGLGEDDYTTGW